MQPLLEFDKVSKKFGNKILLDNISFKLNRGEITTLIGQNGTGKTTIAKIILGLQKYDKGKIYYKKKLKMSYAPQVLDFSFNMPIRANELLKILTPRGLNKEIFNLISFLDFDNIRKKDIADLSGGQLQKLVLSASLAHESDLVILDEPVQYLDLTSQQEFYKSLKIIKEKFGLAIFMISHDLFTVMKNSDQIICVNGHVCCRGKADDIEQNKEFKDALSEIGFYIHNHDHKH